MKMEATMRAIRQPGLSRWHGPLGGLVSGILAMDRDGWRKFATSLCCSGAR